MKKFNFMWIVYVLMLLVTVMSASAQKIEQNETIEIINEKIIYQEPESYTYWFPSPYKQGKFSLYYQVTLSGEEKNLIPNIENGKLILKTPSINKFQLIYDNEKDSIKLEETNTELTKRENELLKSYDEINTEKKTILLNEKPLYENNKLIKYLQPQLKNDEYYYETELTNKNIKIGTNTIIINLTNGLVGYWKLDETSGSVFVDALGYNTVETADTNFNSNSAGKINKSLSISAASGATNRAVYKDNPSNLDFNTDFAFSFWFKVNDDSSLTNNVMFLPSLTDGGTGWNRQVVNFLVRESSSDYRIRSTGAKTTNAYAYEIKTNNIYSNLTSGWNHIVIVRKKSSDNNDVVIYLNGVALSSYATRTNTNDNLRSTFASKFITLAGTKTSVNGGLLNSNIDEVGIWNRVLNITEIETLYNNGSGLSYDDFISEELPFVLEVNFTDTQFSPVLNFSYFGQYSLFSYITSNSNITNVTSKITINDECIDYYINLTCSNDEVNNELTLSESINDLYETKIYPDDIYKEVFFNPSIKTWTETPTNYNIYRNYYHIMNFPNPFNMTNNTLYIEFNVNPKTNSPNLDVYLVNKNVNITEYFSSDFRNKNQTILLRSINKEELPHHNHTINSKHYLIPLLVNNNMINNFSIENGYYLVLFSDTTNINNAWNLRTHTCNASSNWYKGTNTGNNWNIPTLITDDYCPDAHFHTININEDKLLLELTAITENGTKTYNENFSFVQKLDIPVFSTTFINPRNEEVIGNNETLNVSWLPSLTSNVSYNFTIYKDSAVVFNVITNDTYYEDLDLTDYVGNFVFGIRVLTLDDFSEETLINVKIKKVIFNVPLLTLDLEDTFTIIFISLIFLISIFIGLYINTMYGGLMLSLLGIILIFSNFNILISFIVLLGGVSLLLIPNKD